MSDSAFFEDFELEVALSKAIKRCGELGFDFACVFYTHVDGIHRIVQPGGNDFILRSTKPERDLDLFLAFQELGLRPDASCTAQAQALTTEALCEGPGQ